MGLKARVSASVSSTSSVRGFQLVRPQVHHFKKTDGLFKAVKEQAEAIAMVHANDEVTAIDCDGRILGTDYQLSHAAFSDLCTWSKIPVSFIKLLATIDEQQALELVQTMVRSYFRGGVDKSLVIDTRHNRVEGIVGTDTYSPISNLNALEYALSASKDLIMSNGWLNGPNMRLTILSDRNHLARVGDVVRFGMSMENSLHGDRALKVCDYTERLSCTNGATAKDRDHQTIIVHRGDIEHETMMAVVASAHRSEEVLPVIQAAAVHLMPVEEIKEMNHFIKDPKNGGTESLWPKVVKQAKQEALDEGRSEEEVSLWNFVNGITQAAHDTSSLQRRGELETMGYKALVRFGVALVN